MLRRKGAASKPGEEADDHAHAQPSSNGVKLWGLFACILAAAYVYKMSIAFGTQIAQEFESSEQPIQTQGEGAGHVGAGMAVDNSHHQHQEQHQQQQQQGGQQQPGQQQQQKGQQERRQDDKIDPADDIMIVFNTGCNLFQHWQANVLIESALMVGQRGAITRIVSGCNYEEDYLDFKTVKHLTHPVGLADKPVPFRELNKSSHPRYRLHVTPTFEGAKEFPWLNKPQSFEHWLKHVEVKESIIVILDPDMIFLTPLELGKSGKDVISRIKGVTSEVKEGKPVAQHYGIGGGWVEWAKEICGENNPCSRTSAADASLYYSVGPPYIMHRDDLKKVAPKYTKFMKMLVKHTGPDILTDMYAYAMASAYYDLKHTRLDQYMVSAPDGSGEGWDWVEQAHWDPCKHPGETPNTKRLPTLLHYCQNYRAKPHPHMFHKGHVPPNILDCDMPLIKLPPKDYMANQSKGKLRNAAFMACAATYNVNKAVLAYKQKFCPPGFNTEKRFRLLVNGPPVACSHEREGIDCWQLAQLEDTVQPEKDWD